MDGAVYVYDENLEAIGMIDYYTSLIWAKRYNDIGDCEVYVQATADSINLLRKGYFLTRLDDDMVCRIEKIEIDTNAESGNYLIATGYDVIKILNQRVIWNQTNANGTAEAYIRQLVLKNIIDPELSSRKIPAFNLKNVHSFPDTVAEQVTYDNLGTKIREICKTYAYGCKITLEENPDTGKFEFYFDVYKGANRSYEQEENPYVIFSPDYENLSSTKYTEDLTNYNNVALVAGEGEGTERKRDTFGSADGLDRYEVYVDARDVSRMVDYSNLIAAYPDGSIVTENDVTYWRMNSIDVLIITDDQLETLRNQYPSGQVVENDGSKYYRIKNVNIAELNAPENPATANIYDIIYTPLLLTRGREQLLQYGILTSFEGSVNTSETYVYKQDYFLGDVVTVENEYGIQENARIVEIVETFDDSGYTVEPKFEYKGGKQYGN